MKNEYSVECSVEMTPETRKLFDEMNKEYEAKQKEVEALLRAEVEKVIDRIEWREDISDEDRENAKACFRSFGFDIAKSGWNACFEYYEIGGERDEVSEMQW